MTKVIETSYYLQHCCLYSSSGYRQALQVFEDNQKFWILTPNIQWHLDDKVIRGKTPQLLIITQVFGHTS